MCQELSFCFALFLPLLPELYIKSVVSNDPTNNEGMSSLNPGIGWSQHYQSWRTALNVNDFSFFRKEMVGI